MPIGGKYPAKNDGAPETSFKRYGKLSAVAGAQKTAPKRRALHEGKGNSEIQSQRVLRKKKKAQLG
jgi:hypothetical protein